MVRELDILLYEEELKGWRLSRLEKKKKAVRKVIEVYKAMNSLGKVSPSYLLICISELEQGKIDISKGSLVSV